MEIKESLRDNQKTITWKLPDKSKSDFEQHLDEFLTTAITELAAEYSNDPIKWLTVNLWPDGGRLFVFPAQNGPFARRSEKVCFVLSSKYVEHRYAEDIDGTLHWIWNSVGECLTDLKAADALALAKQSHPMKLVAFDYEPGEGRFWLYDHFSEMTPFVFATGRIIPIEVLKILAPKPKAEQAEIWINELRAHFEKRETKISKHMDPFYGWKVDSVAVEQIKLKEREAIQPILTELEKILSKPIRSEPFEFNEDDEISPDDEMFSQMIWVLSEVCTKDEVAARLQPLLQKLYNIRHRGNWVYEGMLYLANTLNSLDPDRFPEPKVDFDEGRFSNCRDFGLTET